jgi:hypothetical protein
MLRKGEGHMNVERYGGCVNIGNYAVADRTLVRIEYAYMHCRPVMFVYVHRYTLFIALYPIGVTGELLCLYAAQAYVARKKVWSLEMPNAMNLTFSYHYFLLFIMFLYIPCKFHTSVIRQGLYCITRSFHVFLLSWSECSRVL